MLELILLNDFIYVELRDRIKVQQNVKASQVIRLELDV